MIDRDTDDRHSYPVSFPEAPRPRSDRIETIYVAHRKDSGKAGIAAEMRLRADKRRRKAKERT